MPGKLHPSHRATQRLIALHDHVRSAGDLLLVQLASESQRKKLVGGCGIIAACPTWVFFSLLQIHFYGRMCASTVFITYRLRSVVLAFVNAARLPVSVA